MEGHHERRDISLGGYKRHIVKIARDLGYTKDVIERIKESKTVNEVDNLMVDARKRMR